MTIFNQAIQSIEDLLKDMQYQHLFSRDPDYIEGVIMGLSMSLEVLRSEEEQEEVHAPKTAAVTEWAKDHPGLQVLDLPCREVDPEDLKGLPTIND